MADEDDVEVSGERRGLTAEEWESREKRDIEAVAALEEWLAAFEKRVSQRADAAVRAESLQKEKLKLFRRQLAMDLAEERRWNREEDRRREEEEINHLSKRRDEDELTSAVLKVLTRGTVESRQRAYEEQICGRRTGVAKLRELAAERREATARGRAAAEETHASRLSVLDRRLVEHKRQDEERRLQEAQEWAELLAERRRRDRARAREGEHRRLREEVAELARQRMVEAHTKAQREREDVIVAASARAREAEELRMRAEGAASHRAVMESRRQLLEQAAMLSDLVRDRVGAGSHLSLLCNAAAAKTQESGRGFGGLRRLVDSTLRPTELSPDGQDPGIVAILRGPTMVDQEVQTSKAVRTAGGKSPRPGGR